MAVEQKGRLLGDLGGNLLGDLRREGGRRRLVDTRPDKVLHDELVVDVVQHHIVDDLGRDGREHSSLDACGGHVSTLDLEDQADLDEIVCRQRMCGVHGGVTHEILDLSQDESAVSCAETEVLDDRGRESRCLDARLGDDRGDESGVDACLDTGSNLVDGCVTESNSLLAKILGDDRGQSGLLDDDAVLGEDLLGNLRGQAGSVLGGQPGNEQLLLDLGGQLALILERLDAVGAQVGFRKGGAGRRNNFTGGLNGRCLRCHDRDRSEQGGGSDSSNGQVYFLHKKLLKMGKGSTKKCQAAWRQLDSQ